jgi:signal transduction histidine kinase/CheY-like chemotaxis protein/sensor domain CHASE-containing protein
MVCRGIAGAHPGADYSTTPPPKPAPPPMPLSPRIAATRRLSANAPSVRSLLTQFAVVAFLVVGTALVLGTLAVDAVIRRVEHEEISDDLTRARLAFERLGRRARQQVEDYAFWDETVRFAQNPESAGATGFFRRNFVEWLPRNDYEFIELLDGHRESAFEWLASPQVRMPSVAKSTIFLDSLARAESVGGYVREGDALYLVGGAAVHPSRRADGRSGGSARGYLVIGRTMHGEALNALQEDLQLGVSILPPRTPLPDNPQHAEPYARGDSIHAYFALAGLTGARAAVIQLSDSRSDLRRISGWTIYGAVLGLLFGAGAFLIVWLYGRRLLITPLRFIASEIEAMHGRGELAEVTSAPPSEEWALFLSTFNETVRSLRDSEQRYGALFDRATDPYFLLDTNTDLVVDANPAAAALIGEPRERLVGAPLPLILRAQPANRNAVRVRRPDGTVQTWGVVETVVTLGERRLLLAAYRDLTDREAMAHSQKMDAIGSLAGGIAHDFNNLMGSVLAGVRVARGAFPDDRRGAAALDAIEHAGRRAAELTRQLVGVTRHEPLVRVPVDVGAAIANIERMCASTFDRRIRIVVDIGQRLPAVEGDPGQVEQALLNLCINARDAMPDGGTLRLSARTERLDANAALRIRDIQPGLYVVVSVADDGIGMSDDVKQRIFEPFFTTKNSGEGTGLGLAMVYGFVRSASGTIVVDSTPRSGTRFDLYLPASQSDAALKTPLPEILSKPSVPRAAHERPTVLLADDEAGLREMLRMVLEHEGYDVLEAANGEEAIALVASHPHAITAVLLDVQMPVLGGLEAYARIRATVPHLPVILGTGFVGSAELSALRDAGADDLITKPYEMRALLDRFARITAART